MASSAENTAPLASENRTNNNEPSKYSSTEPRPSFMHDKDESKDRPRTLTQNFISSIINATALIMTEVLPPTLNLTQKHVLPELIQSLQAMYVSRISDRIQEWVDVVFKILHHFTEVILSNEKGKCSFRLFKTLDGIFLFHFRFVNIFHRRIISRKIEKSL